MAIAQNKYGPEYWAKMPAGGGGTDTFIDSKVFTKDVIGIKAVTACSGVLCKDVNGDDIVRNYDSDNADIGFSAGEYHTFPEGLRDITITGTFIANFA